MTADPQKKDSPEELWMSCRANKKCEGKKAVLVFKKPLPLQAGGGIAHRYRCLTCQGVWHITR